MILTCLSALHRGMNQEGNVTVMAIALGSYPLVEVIFRPGAVDDSAWGSPVRSPVLN